VAIGRRALRAEYDTTRSPLPRFARPLRALILARPPTLLRVLAQGLGRYANQGAAAHALRAERCAVPPGAAR
jgi:hypothetical protein